MLSTLYYQATVSARSKNIFCIEMRAYWEQYIAKISGSIIYINNTCIEIFETIRPCEIIGKFI